MEEGVIKSFDETPLYYRIWETKADKRAGYIILVHGLGEHSGRYFHFAEYFTGKGFDVAAFDLRGHGKSGGKRCDIMTFQDYIDDLDRFITFVSDSRKDSPGFLVGHSMGGLIVLRYGITYSMPLIKSIIASGPLLKIKAHIPGWKILLGRLMMKIAPTFSLPNGIETRHLSRDPEVVKKYEEDPLVERKVTVRWFFNTLQAMEETLNGAHHIYYPVLIMHGGSDMLTDSDASEDFIRRAGARKKKFIRYPHLYHEIFNEPEKEIVFSDLTAWIDELKR